MLRCKVFVVLCTLLVFVQCELDRRDIHRIILKPERSKKKTNRPKQQQYNPYKNIDFDSHSFATNVQETNPHNYQQPPKTRLKPHHIFQNHHEEYHELMQPRPPKREPHIPYNYPEEEPIGDYQQAATHNFNVNYQDNWHPPKSPHPYNFHNSPLRKSTGKPIPISHMIDITTSQPLQHHQLQVQSGYENYINHTQSTAKYKPPPPPPPPQPYHHPNRKQLMYEVHEQNDGPQPPQQTSFHNLSPIRTVVPGPGFLPTVDPYYDTSATRNYVDYLRRPYREN